MLDILTASNKIIKENLRALAIDYKLKTGRVVCLSCPSDIAYMISSLKTIYKMKSFEFKKAFAQYKNKKGDRVTISNSNMTDETAVEFLKTNPERINLFSKFPKNWETLLIGGGISDEETKAADAAEKAANDAAEFEAAEALKSIKVNEAEEVHGKQEESVQKAPEAPVNIVLGKTAEELAIEEAKKYSSAASGGEKDSDCCEDDEHGGEPCEECKEKKRAELSKMKLSELRKAYPEVKATSIKDFVNAVVDAK